MEVFYVDDLVREVELDVDFFPIDQLELILQWNYNLVRGEFHKSSSSRTQVSESAIRFLHAYALEDDGLILLRCESKSLN